MNFIRRVITEKHLQHGKDMCINFKKAFDGVWHERLWNVLRTFNGEEDLVLTIKEGKISTDTMNIMVNTNADIQIMEEVQAFKDMGVTIWKDCGRASHDYDNNSSDDRLNKICNSSRVSFRTNFRLYKSFVIPVMLYGYETKTLLTEPIVRKEVLHEAHPDLL